MNATGFKSVQLNKTKQNKKGLKTCCLMRITEFFSVQDFFLSRGILRSVSKQDVVREFWVFWSVLINVALSFLLQAIGLYIMP